MINNLLKYGVILCLSVFVTSTIADQNTIKNSIERAYPGLKVDTVQPSEVKGLYEVFIGPQLYYVSADGRYLLQGTLRDLKTKKDLTEPKVARARANAIDKVGPEKMVIFKSENPNMLCRFSPTSIAVIAESCIRKSINIWSVEYPYSIFFPPRR